MFFLDLILIMHCIMTIISICSKSENLLTNFRRSNVQRCCLKRSLIRAVIIMLNPKLFCSSKLFYKLRFDAYSFRETSFYGYCWFASRH